MALQTGQLITTSSVPYVHLRKGTIFMDKCQPVQYTAYRQNPLSATAKMAKWPQVLPLDCAILSQALAFSTRITTKT